VRSTPFSGVQLDGIVSMLSMQMGVTLEHENFRQYDEEPWHDVVPHATPDAAGGSTCGRLPEPELELELEVSSRPPPLPLPVPFPAPVPLPLC